MAAGTYDITIEQGATFRRVIRLVGIDANEIESVRMQIRLYTGYLSNIAVGDSSFTVDEEESYRILDVPVISINIHRLSNCLDISMPATSTDDLSFDIAFYDIEVVLVGGYVARLLEGKVFLDKEITT